MKREAFFPFPLQRSHGLTLLMMLLASSAGAQNIDLTTNWDGTSSIASWGIPNTATYGQTITPTARQTTLQSFTFNLRQNAGTAPQCQAFIYQWSAATSRITGSALYSSSVVTAPSGGAFVPVTFNTGGTPLAANQQYVMFLTTSTVTGQASGIYRWGAVADSSYTGGRFVYMNNSTSFNDLSASAWTLYDSDLAFVATFLPTSPLVYSSALSQGNNPALNAARVIDDHANLSALFGGQLTDRDNSNAASQTLPLLTGSSTLAVKSTLSSINGVIEERAEANRGMSSGDDFYGNKSFWMKPFGSWAEQKERNGVSGYKSESFGAVFGADGALSPALRLGGAFAYAKSDINSQSTVAPQSADVDVYHLIGYGTYKLDDRMDLDFQADIGQNTNKGHRQIAFTSTVASSDYDSHTAHLGASIGRTYALSEQTKLTPSAYADYTWIREKGYSETGAGLLNLNVKARTTEALVLGVKGKLTHQLNDQTSLIANLGVGYDTLNKQTAITSTFAGAPEAAFVTYGIDPSPWLAHAGFGAVYNTKTGVEIVGRYDAEYRESFINQTASVKFRWSF